MKRLALIVSIVLVSLGASACRRGPAATPTPEATAEPSSPAGALRVDKPLVQFRASEQDDLQDLDPSSEIEVLPGGNVLVKQNGRAQLRWPGFVTQELLDGTDLLVSLSEPAQRLALLDQAAGTSRYVVQGPDEPATVTVQAGWVQVVAKQGVTDFIVSFISGDPSSVWIAAMDGSVEVRRGTLDETPEPDTAEVVTLGAGEAAAFTPDGPLPEPLAVDRPAVEDWYLAVAGGSAEGSIATVALVCEVETAGPLMTEAQGDTESEVTVASGDHVRVVQRNEDSTWVRVVPEGEKEDMAGWMMAAGLHCVGPVSAASLEGAGAGATSEAPPTATASPVVPTGPTFTPTSTFTPGPTRTFTPTPTGTVGSVEWSFSVDDDEIDEDGCTHLHWDVKNVKEVHISGIGGVPGENQSHEVCPKETTTYTMEITKMDGSKESHSVTVKVNKKSTSTPTSPPAPTEFTLPTNTSPPPTAPPTTAAPPTNPPPTNTTAPPTTAPTNPPAPSDTPAPGVTTVANP